MISMPKLESVTLPSVVGGLGSMNILKDPPKGIFTRRIDKVGETSLLVDWVDSSITGSRICEVIKPYERGKNYMVDVEYGNNSSSGGVIHQYNGLTSDRVNSSSVYNTQAKLPYRIMREGAFRPPVISQFDLTPLSRQPRIWTYASTNPGLPNFKLRMENASDGGKSINEYAIKTCINPTAVYNIQTANTKAPFDVTKMIMDPILFSVNSGVSYLDIVNRENQVPLKGIDDNFETTSIVTNIGSNDTVKYGENIMSVENYISDPLLYSVTSNISGQKSDGRALDDTVHLTKNIPQYQATTNISDMRKDFNSNISSREYKLTPRVSPGEFNPVGLKPSIQRVNNNHINQESSRVQMLKKAYSFHEDRYKN